MDAMSDVELDRLSGLTTARTGRPSQNGASWGDPRELIPGLIRILDIVAVVATGLSLAIIREGAIRVSPGVLVIIALVSLVFSNLLHAADAYKLGSLQLRAAGYGRIFLIWTMSIGGLIVGLYFFKLAEEISRSWIAAWYLLGGVNLLLIRLEAVRRIRAWEQSGRGAVRIAVFAEPATAIKVAARLKRLDDNCVSLVGIFSPRGGGDGACPSAIERKGTTDDLVALCRSGAVDEIIVALPADRISHLSGPLKKMRETVANVSIFLPEFLELDLRLVRSRVLRGLPVISISERPLIGWKGVAKRAEDCVIAGAALIVIAPVMAVIALLIAIDSPGPVLFRQVRHGFHNSSITVLKFRTMYHDPAPDPAVPQAQANDPRVTRLGRFLRRTSLDELPQLINVLRGDMSLVGPRPHAIPHDEKYASLIDNYLARHRVRPGITGLAQVNGYRGETDTVEKMRKRIEHDLKYIEEWSLLLDLSVLFRTLLVGFTHPHAY
jgi:Undecaprenyl-phosphate glucose phosphotransferase